MTGTRIDNAHHVGRHVGVRRRIRDPDNPERFIGVAAEAFLPRDGDGGALSTGWLEFFNGTMEARAQSVLASMGQQRTIRKHDVLGVVCAGLVRNIGLA